VQAISALDRRIRSLRIARRWMTARQVVEAMRLIERVAILKGVMQAYFKRQVTADMGSIQK
jgi:hypothetical protein